MYKDFLSKFHIDFNIAKIQEYDFGANKQLVSSSFEFLKALCTASC